MAEKIRVEYIAIERLERWPRNPKDHDLGSLHQSIDRFGFVSPIIIDERSGKIVAGHGRLDTLAQKMKVGEKPPARVVPKNGTWMVPVIRGISFNSDREAEAYLIADNRQTEIGGWKDDVLMEALKEMAAEGENMLDGIGFDLDDLQSLSERMSDEIGGEQKGKKQKKTQKCPECGYEW